MKKTLALIFTLVFLFTAAVACADGADAINKLLETIRASTSDNIFENKNKTAMIHSPILKIHHPASWFYESEENRASFTGYFTGEVYLLSVVADQAQQIFGDTAVEAIASANSFVGQDGNLLSCYVEGKDRGYYGIYDAETQVLGFLFIKPDAAQLVENELFARCADGYYKNNVQMLEEELSINRGMYNQLLAQLGFTNNNQEQEIPLESTTTVESNNDAMLVKIRDEGSVNVRQKPDADSKRIGHVAAGSIYPCIEIASNGWFKIELEDGTQGYISPKMATLVE